MTGGAEQVAHINSPPPPTPTSVSRLKHTSWYMSDHYICLQYLLFLSVNAQKPKFSSSTVVYFMLADLLGNQ